jgi:hypothetical protein
MNKPAIALSAIVSMPAFAGPLILAEVQHKLIPDSKMADIRGMSTVPYGTRWPGDAWWPGPTATHWLIGPDPWGTAHTPYPMPQAMPDGMNQVVPLPGHQFNSDFGPPPGIFNPGWGGMPYLINPVPLPYGHPGNMM